MGFWQTAKQFRFTVKRSSRTTVVVVCATVAMCLVTLLVIHAFTLHAQSEADKWRATYEQDKGENQDLKDKNDKIGTMEGLEDFAEENLGLADPDTVVITPNRQNNTEEIGTADGSADPTKTILVVVCATVALCLVSLLVIRILNLRARSKAEKWRTSYEQNKN